MPLAFVITLEKELPELAAYTKAKPGKSLARESQKLDFLAQRKNVEPLTSMLSEDPAKLIQQMKDEGLDPTRMRVPPEQWFPAALGLATIKALHEWVLTSPNDVKFPQALRKEFKLAEALLAAAASAGVRFHFTSTGV